MPIGRNTNPTKNLYLLVGPSGSGKSSIAELLTQSGYRQMRSYTTRPPRFEGEDGYRFISEDEFSALEDKIITGTKYHGYHYGATAELMDEADIYILEPSGAYAVLEKYSKRRPVIVIGITAPLKVLEQRLYARGDTPDAIKSRLEGDCTLFGCMTEFCDVVVRNAGELADTKNTVEAIIRHYEHEAIADNARRADNDVR